MIIRLGYLAPKLSTKLQFDNNSYYQHLLWNNYIFTLLFHSLHAQILDPKQPE